MRVRIRLIALLAALALALTACSGVDGASQDGGAASLPSPPLALEHQILGDNAASVPREVTLYRAAEGAMELTTVTRTITPDADGNLPRSALRELLGAQADGSGSLVGGALAGLEDVELCSGVATVCLGVDAAANRSDSDYLLLCASIADTLLGIDGVEAVNVLAGDRSVSVCALPVGLFTQQSENIPAVYAQMQSERERFQLDGLTALTRTACLYFPAYGGRYLLPEPRELSFPDEDYASALIAALCAGPQRRSCCASAVPENLDLLAAPPQLSVDPEGERILDLTLTPVLANYLALSGVESWQLYGSLVLTLTSFLPELDAVRISIDGEYVSDCNLGTRLAFFPDGRMRRSDFAPCVGSSAWLCFVDEAGALAREECAVSQSSAVSPLNVLSSMITLGGSYRPGLRSAFPEGIGPEDVLGVEIEGRVATVNLSANFYAQCQSLDAAGERALIYAMVNALTELDPIGAVGFLVEGRQVDTLVGDIYLRTALLPDPGLTGAPNASSAPDNSAAPDAAAAPDASTAPQEEELP